MITNHIELLENNKNKVPLINKGKRFHYSEYLTRKPKKKIDMKKKNSWSSQSLTIRTMRKKIPKKKMIPKFEVNLCPRSNQNFWSPTQRISFPHEISNKFFLAITKEILIFSLNYSGIIL